MVDTPVCQVFVYGTLKRGQIRERLWPRKPSSIRAARVRGALYDLGEYPAMTNGDDWIQGEVWSFAFHEMTQTLEVLDEIEDYYDRPDDLYKREVINCELTASVVVAAYGYRYAQPLAASMRMQPNANGLVVWPLQT